MEENEKYSPDHHIRYLQNKLEDLEERIENLSRPELKYKITFISSLSGNTNYDTGKTISHRECDIYYLETNVPEDEVVEHLLDSLDEHIAGVLHRCPICKVEKAFDPYEMEF